LTNEAAAILLLQANTDQDIEGISEAFEHIQGDIRGY
jgi:hypothetical protein